MKYTPPIATDGTGLLLRVASSLSPLNKFEEEVLNWIYSLEMRSITGLSSEIFFNDFKRVVSAIRVKLFPEQHPITVVLSKYTRIHKIQLLDSRGLFCEIELLPIGEPLRLVPIDDIIETINPK